VYSSDKPKPLFLQRHASASLAACVFADIAEVQEMSGTVQLAAACAFVASDIKFAD